MSSPSPPLEDVFEAINNEDDDDFLSPHHPSFSQLLADLRRSTLTPHNRLASIRADAVFVARVAAAFGGGGGGNSITSPGTDSLSPRRRQRQRHRHHHQRPLIANERCGSWYVPPDQKSGSAYFKSTDGHERAWKFSTRRLNLHLVDLVEKNDGIIIVDSTRRGKRMPDALSTTIPIWCTVLNLVLLPSNPLSSNLFLPPYLPASSHAQITALIPSFVASLRALNLSLPTCLTKPLRPLWITQESTLPLSMDDGDDGEETDGEHDSEDIGGKNNDFEDSHPSDVSIEEDIFQDYRPVICCTASKRVVGSEMDQGGYIQGAGDDTENWAQGLTPDVFWTHTDDLLEASEAELPALIVKLVQEHKTATQTSGHSTRTQLTPHISVCPLPLDIPHLLSGSQGTPMPSPAECYIILTESPTPQETWIKSPKHMEVGIGKNKVASRNLRLALPEICNFAVKFLQNDTTTGQVIVACDSGKDISIGTALALSCYLFDEEGQFRIPGSNTSFTKTLVKVKLGAIMIKFPEANPSRSTLQSVNSFLMDWRK